MCTENLYHPTPAFESKSNKAVTEGYAVSPQFFSTGRFPDEALEAFSDPTKIAEKIPPTMGEKKKSPRSGSLVSGVFFRRQEECRGAEKFEGLS
ncbi:hypothetical protein ACU8KH_02552 [Lachancea thermotolerans]